MFFSDFCKNFKNSFFHRLLGSLPLSVDMIVINCLYQPCIVYSVFHSRFFCLKNYNPSTFCRQLDKILDLFCCGNTRSWSEKILFYVYDHVNISKMENIFSYLGDEDIPFHTTSLFLYHLKISENPWKFLFLWCFQVVQKKAVTWNRIYEVN